MKTSYNSTYKKVAVQSSGLTIMINICVYAKLKTLKFSNPKWV